jgi:hypothetical protein
MPSQCCAGQGATILESKDRPLDRFADCVDIAAALLEEFPGLAMVMISRGGAGFVVRYKAETAGEAIAAAMANQANTSGSVSGGDTSRHGVLLLPYLHVVSNRGAAE